MRRSLGSDDVIEGRAEVTSCNVSLRGLLRMLAGGGYGGCRGVAAPRHQRVRCYTAFTFTGHTVTRYSPRIHAPYQLWSTRMNRQKYLVLCIAVAAGGFALDAAARPPAFSDIDGDKDGRVSLSEFQAKHAERFASLDTDGDGYLSETELVEARGKRRPRERRE